MWPHNRKENSYIHRRPLKFLKQKKTKKKKPYTLTRSMLSHAAARASHLCFPLLQEGLEPLLSSPPLVVVAHYQDDVVPVELAHQVEPHMRLVGVGRDCPQEGQMDALRSAEREMEVNTVRLNTVSTTAILCWRGSMSHRVVAHNQAEKNCLFLLVCAWRGRKYVDTPFNWDGFVWFVNIYMIKPSSDHSNDHNESLS